MRKTDDGKENNVKSEYEKINKRRRVSIRFDDESLTKQEMKEEQDINFIVKKYQQTGEFPEQKQGYYADTTKIPDYREALEIVNKAQDAFESLPAKVRAEFMNDPGTMIKFIDDPNNRARAVELGLLTGDTVKTEPKPPEKKDEIKVENTK